MIVEMKKIIVLCTQSNQDEMLKSLRSLKVLHLDKIKPLYTAIFNPFSNISCKKEQNVYI